MTTFIKSGIVFGICALLMVSSVVNGQGKDKKKAPNIVGNYTFVGNEGGDDYTGTGTITAHGDAFKVSLTTTSEKNEAGGHDIETGIGILTGRILSVSWVFDANDSKGIAVFRLSKDDKKLVGKWAYFGGEGKLFTETLTKVE
ncbi:MAG: hypothetical protein ABGY96_08550 [bacterium]